MAKFSQKMDERTKRLAPLSHPRDDDWQNHFKRSRGLLRIYGYTATGRATVTLLRMNDYSEQCARQIQRDYLADLFPVD